MATSEHTRASVLRKQQLERKRRKVVAFLAVLAAFVTFAALMLPAISMTSETAPAGSDPQALSAELDEHAEAASPEATATAPEDALPEPATTKGAAPDESSAADAATKTAEQQTDARAAGTRAPGASSEDAPDAQAEPATSVKDAQAPADCISDSAKDWLVTVIYDEDSGFTDKADLRVREITKKSDKYKAYLAKAEAAVSEKGQVSRTRFFDITVFQDGEEIQPEAPVKVQVELTGKKLGNPQVVHFADKPELIAAKADADTVTFEADGFSVYAIVEVDEPETQEVTVGAPADLDGNGFLIVSDWQYIGKSNYLTSRDTGYLTPARYDSSGIRYAATHSSTGATVFYFEQDPTDETGGRYFIYYLDETSTKQYLSLDFQSGSLAISTAATQDDATAYTIGVADTDLITISYVHNSKTYSLGNYGSARYQWDNTLPTAHNRYKMTVIHVPTVDDDPHELDGKTYGIAFDNDGINAITLESQNSAIGSQGVLIQPDVLEHAGMLLVAPDSTISKWTFTNLGEDLYTIQDADGNYLSISKSGAALKAEADDTCKITITAGSGDYAGKIRLSCGGYALATKYQWDNNKGYEFKGFTASNADSRYVWFNLAKDSILNDDDFHTYTAEKISVTDEVLSATEKDANGDIAKDESGQVIYKDEKAQVVIYTRVWNEKTTSYEHYAVDHDGTLVRVYESGDNISWTGSDVNTLLWEFTEYTYADGTPNYYYELQNVVYGNYIAPQTSGGQVVSGSTIGVNLNGRRYGEDHTTIIAWDDAAYSYAGLKVQDGRVVSCPLSEADDFYFATMTEEEEDEEKPLSTVATVDNNAYGITMKMQNYPYQGYYISGDASSVYRAGNGGYRSLTQAQVLGYDNKASSNGTGDGLLSTDLKEDGYPTATFQGASLATLYNEATTANHLFLQSIYDETGYFEYDSTQNFAQLDEATGNFTVYDQLATGEVYTNRPNYPYHAHGMFLPYNDISEADYSSSLTNWTDMAAQELPDTDPRKGEKLYCFDGSYPGASSMPKAGAADYFFGMELGASFTQTPNGLDAWGHDIIFEFSGDDDFWFYIDGELIVDLGGVRAGIGASGGAQSAKVNFRTGEVVVNGKSTTLYALFESHYAARVAAGTMTQEQADQKLADTFTLNAAGQHVFKDYTNHAMKIFFMERGAGASNLHMRFNLAAVKPGTFLLSKKLSGAEVKDSSLIEFPYQVYYYMEADGESVPHLLGAENGEEDLVLYEGSTRTLNSAGQYSESFTPAQGTQAYEHVFFLKPGETAEVTLPDGATRYYVVECGVNPDLYDKVSANGEELTGTATANSVSGTARKDYATSADITDNRSKVEYDNHVSEGAMRTLSITKRLYDVDGATELAYPDVETTFSLRLYLGDENASAGSLPLANLYSYYIKDAAGHYCRWDMSSQSFVSLGDDVTSYDALVQYFEDNSWTDAQKESVIFKTSMNGAISKIPAGYTVEVRNLVISTQYKVEERDNEIPKGYTRREADGYTRTDTEPDVMQSAPYTGTIAKEEDPAIDVRNQKGWGLTVQKVWTDKDFMASHDDIYFAVYLDKDAVNAKEGRAGNAAYAEDVLLPATVYRMATDETEVYYFFDDLKYNGNTYQFSDFSIREVMVAASGAAGLAVAADGNVAVSAGVTVTPISGAQDDNTLTVGGTPVGGSHQDGYSYTVSYKVGASTGKNENIRTDTVTNSRPGIKLYKTDWTGAWSDGALSGALAGARFSLTDASGENVGAATYTSGSDGLITIAYLNAGTYYLTETATPGGYVCLDDPVAITVDEDGKVSVGGVDSEYYILDTTADASMAAVITIKNRSVGLEAVKVDANDRSELAGVHFALYRQVTDSSGNARKDYLPLAGYEDIVTGEDGVLPNVTMNLGAGTYYLTEKTTVSGYALLSEDVCFTIGNDGTVTLNNGAATGSAIARAIDATGGRATYELSIPNYKLGVKLKKVDEQSRALSGAKFSLSMMNSADTWESVAAYANIDMSATSVTTLSSLEDGFYKLTETKAPAGYVLLDKDVYVSIDNGVVRVTDEAGVALAESDKAAVSTEQDKDGNTVYVITVTNTPGDALPTTGGPGTGAPYALGLLLLLAGAALLFRSAGKTRRVLL